MDELQHGKLGEVLCHAERLQACSGNESSLTRKHTCNLSDLTVADRMRGLGVRRGMRKSKGGRGDR